MSSEPTLLSLAVQLAEIKGLVSATHLAVQQHIEADVRTHADHENRIRKNEESRWRVQSITGAIVFVCSVTGSALLSLLTRGKM